MTSTETVTEPSVVPPGASRGSLLAQRMPTIVLGVVAIGVVVGMLLTPAFLTAENVRAVLQTAALTGIVAVTMTPMAMSGNFVSLGTQQSTVLAAMAFVYLLSQGTSVPIAVIVAILGLLALGAVQGVVVALGLNSVITTLAFGTIVFGVIQRLNSGGTDVKAGANTVSWGSTTVLGLPIQVVVLIVVTVVMTAVMSRTVVGRYTMLCGANRDTARLSGIPVAAITVGVFAVSSAGMGVAGVLGGAQFGQAGTSDFSGLTFAAVSAILVGGTSIAGGMGSPLRSAFGAIVISTISSLMTLNSLSPGVRGVVEGGLVIGVVIAIETARRRQTRG